MAVSKCPACGCKRFYIKNPDDPYDIHAFECRDGKACFEENPEGNDCPELDDAIETYCDACAWHDKFHKIR
jgi:hypothetical protein